MTSATVGFRRVVSIVGEVDLASVGTLQEGLDAVLLSCERDIWIDFGKVTGLGTWGVHVLLDIARSLDRDQRRLAVIVPPGPVLRVLRLTGADEALTIFPDRTSAQRLS